MNKRRRLSSAMAFAGWALPSPLKKQAWRRAALGVAVAAAALQGASAHAADWVDFGFVSGTLGNTGNRLCQGAPSWKRASDFGCPAHAPYLSSGGLLGIGTTNPNAAVDVYGTVSATNFVGDGSGLTGVVAGATDRIVSGSTGGTRMVAISATGYISITQAGANSGWFNPYTGLVTLGVSSSGGISGSSGYFTRPVGIGTTAPSSTLYVVGGTGASGGIKIGDTSGSDRLSIYHYGSLSAALQLHKYGGLFITNNSGARFAAFQSNGNGLIVGSSFVDYAPPANGMLVEGKVGIGTLSATATLQVSGTFTVSTSVNPTAPSLFVDAAGKVGVGTAAPARGLHIKGEEAGILLEEIGGPSDNEAYLVNYNNNFNIQRRRADGTFLNEPYSFDMRAPDATLVATSSGSIGIGTTAPGSSLTIIGEAQVGNSGAACVSATNGGAIRYNAGTLYYCNAGNAWTALGTGSGTVGGTGSATTVAFWNGTNSLSYDSGLYWDNGNKRLGVGTTTPGTTLDVSGTLRLKTNADTLLMLDTQATGQQAAIGFYSGGGTKWQLGKGTSDQFFLWDPVGVRNVMNIYSNGNMGLMPSGGNVGVGTFSPSATLYVNAGEKTRAFYVDGSGLGQSGGLGIFGGGPQLTGIGWRNHVIGNNLYLPAATNIPTVDGANANYTKAYAISFASEDNTDTGMSFWTGAGTGTPMTVKMRLSNAGSLGIGTLTPGSSLTVAGEAQVGNSGAACVSATNGGAIRYSSGTLYYCNAGNTWTALGTGTGTVGGTGSATAVAFWSNPSTLTYESDATSGLYWDTTGKRLGIGTNAPSADLTVTASRTSDVGVAVKNTSSDVAASASVGAASDVASFAVMARSSGMTGINSTGRESGVAFYTNIGATGGLTLSARNPSGRMYFYTGGSNWERMRLDELGRLGLGTQSPTATLQVSGSFIVSSSATPSSPSLYVGVNGGVSIASTTNDMFARGSSLYVARDRGRWGMVIAAEPFSQADMFLVTNGNAPDQRVFQLVNAENAFEMRTLTSANSIGKSFFNADLNTGNVGISNTAPLAKLDVAGTISASDAIQVGNSALTCGTPIAGALRYNGGSIQYCNGSSWSSLSSGAGTLTGSGSATAIAFWNGTNSLSYESATNSGLYWDAANKRLGVGTNEPVYALDISGSLGGIRINRRISNPPNQEPFIQFYDASATSAVSQIRGLAGGGLRITSGDIGETYVYISNTGMVGIGTNSPSGTLHIAQPGANVRINANANNGNGFYGYNDATGNLAFAMSRQSVSGQVDMLLTSYGGIAFQPNGINGVSASASAMYLTKAANLGIGTQSPTATLQVSGTFTVSNSVYPNSPSLFVDSNGNVGIGTASPFKGLHIKGYAAGIMLEETTGPSDNEAYLVNYNSAFNIQRRRADGTFLVVPYSFSMLAPQQTFTATSAGNIIIGNAIPGASLTVAGEVQVSSSGAACVTATNGGAIRYNAGTLYYCNASNTWAALGTSSGSLTGTGSATAVAFWNGTNSLTYDSNLYWDNVNKRLGVGVRLPSAALAISQSDISGNSLNIANTNGTEIAFSGASANANIVNFGNGSKMYINTSNGPLYFGNGGVGSNDVVLSGGLVGVGGIPAPSANLQVSGSVLVSSTITSGSPSLYIPTTGGVSIGSTTNAWVNSGTSLYITRYPNRWGMAIVGDKNMQSDMFLITNSNLPDQRAFQFVNAANQFAMRTVTDDATAVKSFLNINLTTGSVGISNTAPIAKLDVIGTISASDAIQVGQSGLSCINGISGSIRFNTTSNTLQVCTNAGWVSLASRTTAAGGTPAGNTGDIQFNTGGSFDADTGKLYWDKANDRLGIGTASPSLALEISTTGVSGIIVSNTTKGVLNASNIYLSRGDKDFGYAGLTLATAGYEHWVLNIPAGTNDLRLWNRSSLKDLMRFTPSGTAQVFGNFIVSQTGQNTLASASLVVDNRGVSITSILHITGSPISPIGGGGNAILSGSTAVSTSAAGSITFVTNGVERMQIGTNGYVGIGTTPRNILDVYGSVGTMVAAITNSYSGGGQGGLMINLPNALSGTWMLGFGKGGTAIGSVAYNGTGVTYNTTSDRRTKENITETREGLQKLMQLPVRNFSFKTDPSHTIVTGFIAQELNTVFPDAVTTNGDNGETPLKDQGKPWAVDYGRVTPLIVKGVQELKVEGDERFRVLKADNDNLRAVVSKQQERLDDLAAELEAMKAAR